MTKSVVADDVLLAQLGYRQEFKRNFNRYETISFAISIMGVIASVSSTLSFGLVGGGHAGIVWGWFIPGIFVMHIALSMAEMASSMPTSGGLYYWAAELASPKWSAFASWMTGYSNVIGQIALVSSIDFTASQMIVTALTVASDFETVYTLNQQYGIFFGLICFHAILCCSATKFLARLNLFYVAINLGTAVATIIVFAVAAPSHVSASDAFTLFENGSSWNSGTSFLLAFTAPMWTMTGYDSAAHIAEEVANATSVAPIAIVSAVAITWILGFFVLIATSFAILDVGALLGTSLSLPMAQVYYDVLGKQGMLAIWSFVIIIQFTTAAAQLVDASRVVFAFSRDDALPLSKFWKRIHPFTQTPVNATLVVALCSALLGLLALSAQAGAALFDVSVIGLYISYAIPIFLRITSGRSKFKEGPFSLGSWSVAIGSVSVAWVSFIVVILLFPANPDPTPDVMNYAVVILGVILGGASLWYWISARNWFHGPIKAYFADGSSSISSQFKDDEEKVTEKGKTGMARVVEADDS